MLNHSVKGIWPTPISYEEYDTLLMKTKTRLGSYAVDGKTPNRKTTILLNTSLLAASHLGEGRDIEFLLSKGANAQCVDEQIRTPIHYSCKIIDLKSVSMLYDYGGDLDAKDLSGITPLHIAAETGGYELMKFLLESAVDVDCIVMSSGNTPLHISARRGDLDCCRLLIQYGASKHKMNLHRQTPADLASINQRNNNGASNMAVIRLLTSETDESYNTIDDSRIQSKNLLKDNHEDTANSKHSPTTDNTYSSYDDVTHISTTRMIKASSGKALANLRVNVNTEPPPLPLPASSSSSSSLWETKTDSDEDDDDFDTRSITSEELKNILLNENENDREERERKAIIESTTLTSLVSDAIWVSGSWMLGKTASVITNAASMVSHPFTKSKSSNSSISTSLSSLDDNNNHQESLPLAPPTDFELSQKGMGFVSESGKFHKFHSSKSHGKTQDQDVSISSMASTHTHTYTHTSPHEVLDPVVDALTSLMAPPARYISSPPPSSILPPPSSVAKELNAHVEAMKLGLTPKNNKPQIPDEVALAIMMAKNKMEIIAERQKMKDRENDRDDDDNDDGNGNGHSRVHGKLNYDDDADVDVDYYEYNDYA